MYTILKNLDKKEFTFLGETTPEERNVTLQNDSWADLLLTAQYSWIYLLISTELSNPKNHTPEK